MPELLVADAGPLIALARIEGFGIAAALARRCLGRSLGAGGLPWPNAIAKSTQPYFTHWSQRWMLSVPRTREGAP